MDTTAKAESIQISVAPEISVGGVVGIPEWWPTGTRVAVVLAHDSSANMDGEFLVAMHRALAERGYLSLRFNFPWVEGKRKRPDPPLLLERAYRAAIASLMRDAENAPARLILGGFGLGARVAADVVAHGVKSDGLVLVSYPLHPAGKPNRLRADPLFRIICPMLFVQGTRDASCKIDRLQTVLRRVGAPTGLHVVEDADHKLGLIKRSSRTPEEVQLEVLEAISAFLERAAGAP
jgi:predicted alpha/beta-hydrolase family hydrolase